MPNILAKHTRRQFLLTSSAAAVGGALALQAPRAYASPLGLPLGIQLYSVREMLKTDYAGTLQKLAALGYKQVEAAGFYDKSPEQVKAALAAAGLTMPSSHYASMALQGAKVDEVIAYGQKLGLEYIICSFPGIKDTSRLTDKTYRGMVNAFTAEDYRWNADQFNMWGRKVKAAGMKFGYHNHTMEFVAQNGSTGFDLMVQNTDPELVTFEMDCGWVSMGGGDPVALLRKYPTRISMLHIKDFKATSKPATVLDPPDAAELGTGTVKFRPIFEAAKETGHIRHYFVEQEAYDMPPFEALRIDADYMKALNV